MSAPVTAPVGAEARTGTVVCTLGQIDREGGVTALVDGEAVAVFRTHDDQVFALGNYDPFSGASVLARGILGTRAGTWFVASPMHKQAFDLATGHCLDDAAVAVPTYDVWLDGDRVVVGGRRPAGSDVTDESEQGSP